jgi:hypothetical protein
MGILSLRKGGARQRDVHRLVLPASHRAVEPSMIDELPLDLFGEDDTRTTPQPASEGGTTALPGPETIPAVSSMTTTHRRVYDAVAIAGLAIAIGLPLRVVAMGWSLPVVNVAIAALVYLRGRPAYRAAYVERMETLRARLEEERTALTAQPAPGLPREQRWLYDGLAVVVLGTLGAIVLLLLGFESWMPTSWVLGFAGGAVVYFWLARGYRNAWYALTERYRRRLFDVRNEANPG